jgi:hypothetical protein
MTSIRDIKDMYLIDINTGERITYSLNEIENYKLQCKQFGNLDGMEGCCHECNEDSHDLFQACWYEKFKDIKPKQKR